MGTMRISFDEAYQYMKRVLQKHGCPEEKADKVAYEMARNSLEGTYTHGINRFCRLIANIDQGIVKPPSDPEIIRQSGALAQIDGHLGLGITNAWFAMEKAIQIAGDYGIGLAALRNTNHWMRAATYGYQACDAGMAAICFTNTMPNMPTWGAEDSKLGNNPLVFAFPGKSGHIMVDMAMSQFSYGALELARLEGRMMPIDAGFGLDGELTKDPDQVIRSQRILPTGYWKGAALSFLLDLFASVLSAGNTVAGIGALPGDEHGVSQIFMAIDYKRLTGQEEAERIVGSAMESLLSSRPAPGTDRIIYTGQPAKECRIKNLEQGIPVDAGVWNQVMQLG